MQKCISPQCPPRQDVAAVTALVRSIDGCSAALHPRSHLFLLFLLLYIYIYIWYFLITLTNLTHHLQHILLLIMVSNAIQQVINEGWNSFACKRNYSDFKDLIETNILEKLLEDYDLSANVEQIGDYRPIHLPKTRITFHANPITLANNFNRDSGTVSLNQGLGISKKSNTTPYPLPNEEGGDADFNKR